MKKLVTILTVALLSCSSNNDERIAKIDKVLTSFTKESEFNGTVLIAEKGEILYEKSYGFADYDKGTHFDSFSIFNIASVSKTFTAVAIMQLEEKENLDLDENITEYLSELPYEKITVRNLLTHTSGLPMIQTQPFLSKIAKKGFTNNQIMKLFIESKPKLHFEPGTGYNYANTNYIFLALIVEKLSGKDFHRYLAEHIFQKADMQNSFLGRKRVPDGLKTKIVPNYIKTKWLFDEFQDFNTLPECTNEEMTFGNHYGASSIYTTARDLLKFHSALQSAKLLNKASLQKMYAAFRLKNNQDYTINPDSNYPATSSLAWRVAKDSSNGKIVFHSGGTRGGRSFFIRNLTKNQCIIILTNNEETNRNSFSFPMKALNGKVYELDKGTMPKLFVKEYSKNGITSAVKKYHELKTNEKHRPFVDWDFEEIGTELIEKKDYHAAIELFKLYAEQFSDEYSWSMLADAYVLIGATKDAEYCFKKALESNPEYENAKKGLINIQQK